MEKFEYKYDDLKNYIGIIKHQELITERGLNGWELVSVIMIKVCGDDIMRFYWKRKKI